MHADEVDIDVTRVRNVLVDDEAMETNAVVVQEAQRWLVSVLADYGSRKR